jgi:hypothetical protein
MIVNGMGQKNSENEVVLDRYFPPVRGELKERSKLNEHSGQVPAGFASLREWPYVKVPSPPPRHSERIFVVKSSVFRT